MNVNAITGSSKIHKYQLEDYSQLLYLITFLETIKFHNDSTEESTFDNFIKYIEDIPKNTTKILKDENYFLEQKI